MATDPSAAQTHPAGDVTCCLPGLALLLAAEAIALAALTLVALGTHYSYVMMNQCWRPELAEDRMWMAVGLMAAAGAWIGIHAMVWIAARGFRLRWGRRLAQLSLALNLLCAPVLVCYAWRPLVTVLITDVSHDEKTGKTKTPASSGDRAQSPHRATSAPDGLNSSAAKPFERWAVSAASGGGAPLA